MPCTLMHALSPSASSSVFGSMRGVRKIDFSGALSEAVKKLASRQERLEGEPPDGREVFDVGGNQRGLVFDGGGGDERIGQAQAV